MIIKYNAVNILTIGTPSGQSLRLIPGNNEIDDQKFKRAIENNPIIQNKMNDGIIVIVDVPVLDSTNGDDIIPEGLGKYKPKDAIEYVTDLYDLNILNSYLKMEKRPKVLKAIKQQIKKIDEAIADNILK